MCLLGGTNRRLLICSYSIKSKGNYDDGMFKSGCVLIQPNFMSPSVYSYVHSDGWKKAIYWDEILHQAANASLDMTIDKLGIEEFQRNSQHFVERRPTCQRNECSNVVFPCDANGTRRIRNDCL